MAKGVLSSILMVETMTRETNSDGNYDDGVGSASFAKKGVKARYQEFLSKTLAMQ